uniref:EamA domain-containing protein n=1 Tax=Chromera velia CCMP2878 TaxID=1169474 RepID=A0A0G4FBN7_9ALVE|eukprot:Cvel_16188.t1-p1 / transcript=Cvel_16188.t1 / gene=Cvel_16188 / organism=Chromera_velia_CCMP2878 / gene_product=hypothetical protein / transcript_product=hypothetical protein / location=Cvel_scaffold1235:31192-33221(+) / protein_length=402 / sequence_SO=supercontig / SO=protein_coding / is_pseudo=false
MLPLQFRLQPRSVGRRMKRGETGRDGQRRETGGSWWRVFRSLGGLICAALGAFAFSLMALTSELATVHIRNPFLVTSIRGFVQALLCAVVYSFQRIVRRLCRNRRRKGGVLTTAEEEEKVVGLLGPCDLKTFFFLWVGRAFLGGSAATLFIFCLSQLPLGDVSALNSCNPLVAAVIGRVWLKERLHWLVWLAGALTVVGALIIARPPFLAVVLEPVGLTPSDLDVADRPVISRPVAVALAILQALIAATAIVCILDDSVLGRIAGVPLWGGWGMACLVGVCAFGAQGFWTVAVVLEKVGPSAFAMVLDTPFSFVLQALVMGTPLGAGSLVGGSLIVCSVFLLFAVKIYCTPKASSEKEDETASEKVEGGGAEGEGEALGLGDSGSGWPRKALGETDSDGKVN